MDRASEQDFVASIEAAFVRRGWDLARQSFFGRRGDVVAHLPDGDLLLVEVKPYRDRVRFSDIAQLAEWQQLTSAVDQVDRALVVLATDGEVTESIRDYARDAGISILSLPPAPADAGELVATAVEDRRAGIR